MTRRDMLLASAAALVPAASTATPDPGPLPGGVSSIYRDGVRIGWFDMRPGDVVTVRRHVGGKSVNGPTAWDDGTAWRILGRPAETVDSLGRTLWEVQTDLDLGPGKVRGRGVCYHIVKEAHS